MQQHTLAALILTFVATSAAASETRLTCDAAVEETTIEATLMKQAPDGAKRVSEHVLELRIAGAVKRFADQPPHEDLEGTRWTYCGYDAANRMHLIGKRIDDEFTGVLLSENTGRQRKAGHTVFFAPDGKRFLALEQRNGKDGEDWTLYAITGRKRWSGYAGVIRNGKTVEAQFVEPYWNKDGTLGAHVSCSSDISNGTVALQATPAGMLWLPVPSCPR